MNQMRKGKSSYLFLSKAMDQVHKKKARVSLTSPEVDRTKVFGHRRVIKVKVSKVT